MLQIRSTPDIHAILCDLLLSDPQGIQGQVRIDVRFSPPCVSGSLPDASAERLSLAIGLLFEGSAEFTHLPTSVGATYNFAQPSLHIRLGASARTRSRLVKAGAAPDALDLAIEPA